MDHDKQNNLFGNSELPAQAEPATTGQMMNQTFLAPLSSIRLWPGNPRSKLPFEADRDRALIDSIAAHGQKIACIVRPMENGRFELIVGCRRYGSVAHLAIADPEVRLLIEVRPMNDIEAFILVDGENAARKDVTPYERATYQHWALKSLFKGKQADLAKSLRLSETTLSRSLDLVRLPTEVNAVIADLNALNPNLVATIAPKCNDPALREKVIEAANAIGAEGKTYAAGRAIALINARLDPVLTIRPMSFEHAGRRATISAATKTSMVVKIPLHMGRKARVQFLKRIMAEMPGFAARMAGDVK